MALNVSLVSAERAVWNGEATLVVAKWCKQLDESTLQRELAEGGKSTSLEGLREAA